MNELIGLKYIVNSILFSGIGIIVFLAGFVLIDILTPKVQVWNCLLYTSDAADE